MWRVAGDTATDFNHYSKRVTAALYTATMPVFWIERYAMVTDTRAFPQSPHRRCHASGEAFKAQWRGSRDHLPSLSRFPPGRLRYPAA